MITQTLPFRTLPFRRRNGTGVGFWQTAALATSIITNLAATGLTAYGTVTQLDLLKEQAELTESLARKKAELEEELLRAQKRIYEIQTAGLAESQKYELEIMQAQADYTKRQLERLEELENIKAMIEKDKLERELLLQKLESNQIISDTIDNTLTADSVTSQSQSQSGSAILGKSTPYKKNLLFVGGLLAIGLYLFLGNNFGKQ